MGSNIFFLFHFLCYNIQLRDDFLRSNTFKLVIFLKFTYLKWILFSQNSHNDKFSRQFNQAKIFRVKYKFNLIYCSEIELLTSQTHSTLLQAEEKRARNSVPKCPFKQPQPASGRSAGWSWLKGQIGTGLRARFFCSFEYRWPCQKSTHFYGPAHHQHFGNEKLQKYTQIWLEISQNSANLRIEKACWSLRFWGLVFRRSLSSQYALSLGGPWSKTMAWPITRM